MISSRAVAMHGLGYDSLLIAQHGLLPIVDVQPQGGGGFTPIRIRSRSRRRDEEEEIMAVIIAFLHTQQ